MAQIVVITGSGSATPLAVAPETVKEALKDLSPLLKEIAEQIIQPAFARNYDKSGLKVRSGMLKTAVSKTGAREPFRNRSALPDSRRGLLGAALCPVRHRGQRTRRRQEQEGAPLVRRERQARLRKARQAPPPHDIIYLTEADYEKVADYVTRKLVEMGAQPITK